MKILHLSNVAGKLGGGVSEVVNSLMNYQNKIVNPYLWFMGGNNIVDEIHNDIGVDKKRLYAMPSFLGIKSIVSPTIFFKELKNEPKK